MIYLIDASVYVFRAWFSLPDTMTDPLGRPVNAAYGFARFLSDFLEQAQPELVAVAFDESLTTSHRNDLFPEYKANRDPAPEELKRQFAICRDITRGLGLAEFGSDAYEADDIIGTLAQMMRKEGRRTVVLSRDKDLAQVLSDGDEYWDFAGDRRIAYADIAEHFGVVPERIADYLALMGDKVDNIPGVPGIGKKTAAALMTHFDGLDDLYTRLDEVPALNIRGAKTLPGKLREHEATARLARQLTEIYCEVPLDTHPDALRWRGPKLEQLNAVYAEAGFGDSLRLHAERLAAAHT